MMTDQRATMFEWMFKPHSLADRIVHLGFGGFLLAALAKDALKQLTPSAGVTFVVCFAFALLLALPAVVGNTPPHDAMLRSPTLALAIAYLWMALLYFFNWTHLYRLPAGYDALTDIVGTVCFAVAWFMFSELESDKQSKLTERFALTILVLLALTSGASKLVIDLSASGGAADGAAARLFLNVCNGAIFLSLYGQMRRLLPSPDLVTHSLILLYGCAQIAAHGRDCLSASNPCVPPAVEGLVALAIAWTLLLGKVAFGLYVSYLYFNGRVGRSGVQVRPKKQKRRYSL